jgi:hypothetical protein
LTADDPVGDMRGARWHLEAVRCPYCVQGNEFKAMIDLTGGAGGIFYCTTCRHLVRTGEPEFRCLCPNCKKQTETSLTA